MKVRFGRWSGTQEPFPADVSADAVLEEISDDVLGGRAPEQALQRLARQGMQGRFRGTEELRRRVEEAQRRELERMGVEGPLREVEERLGEILDRERTALDFAADEADAAARSEQLDALPDEVAAKMSALEDYHWYDAQAEQQFRELREQLREQVAQATFGRLASALGQMGPEDVQRMNDLLAELNDLVERRDRGEDISEAFEDFKQRYADVLPGDPETLDELLEELARRMAAMSRLLGSLDAEQRAQLAELAEQMLGDMDLAFQADQLTRTLREQFPELGWDEGMPGAMPAGEESGSLSQTVDWMEHLQSYEDLSTALGQSYPGARLEDIDEDEVRRLLGEEAARDVRALREIERVLEEAGAARREHGKLELTPRGIRRIGERSLARIYERTVGLGAGSHGTPSAGGDGELIGSTRPLRFGDPFRVDVARTVRNAIVRGGRDPESGALSLAPEDFELAEAEQRVRTTTVLLLDMSFSMPLRGNWVPAKRVALALHSLISSKFPEDRFHVVGFSDYARQLQPGELLTTGWERVYGTNMEHAFMIARRLLGARPSDDGQVIMVTDGEPTAHLEGDVPYFAWPPEPETIRRTMAEASKLARTGATLNVFLLDHDPGAAAFVERMVGDYGGRIFYPDLENLGHLVVRDFLRQRRGSASL